MSEGVLQIAFFITFSAGLAFVAGIIIGALLR